MSLRTITLHTLISLLCLSLITSCSDGEAEMKKVDPAFSQYISGFTSGVISKKSDFVIRLAKASKKFTETNGIIEEELFDFSPDVKGKAFWENNQTIRFVPDAPLQSGTNYTIEFDLGNVLDVEQKFTIFEFSSRTITQSFEVDIDGMAPYDNQELIWNSFKGKLRTADFLGNEKAEELLAASQDGEKLKIKWLHDPTGREHGFSIDSVERKEDAGVLFLEWDGSSHNIDVSGELEYEIPSLSDFKLMETKVIQQPEQHIVIRFSDPLKHPQDLTGFIRLSEYSNFRFEVSDNVVKAYPEKRQSGTKELLVEQEIRNTLGYKLMQTEKVEIAFIEVKPAVKITHEGTILPGSNGLVFPFQAVNLSAVDVKVIKIFQNNIHQYFQVNNHLGSSQIRRVGKTILKKKINLVSDQPIDYGTWNNFSLDLAELIEADPGAIYRIQIDFRKSYSMYPCESQQEGEELEAELEDSWEEEPTYDEWGYYDDYSGDYYYYNYDWSERDNPCHTAYYRRNRGVSTNILASNIGLIAKGGKDRKLLVAVNDIRTTEPMKGAKLELYDYQNQKIGEEKTGRDGTVWIDLAQKPFLLIASKGNEKGYLKLDDGAALSTSHFDVRGEVVQEGLKGFLYGERGVWRPGDTLFLNFILEDHNRVLPEGHPVKLELFDPQGQLKEREIRTAGMNGFYNFTLPTDPDALTGSWSTKVKVGGASFSKNVRIETIKPNRLKIKLDFDADVLSANQPGVTGDMEVKWLHGATAKNLKTKIAVTLSEGKTEFEGYEKYTFTDPAKDYTPHEQVIFDGKIDENGQAEIPVDLKVTDAAPGMLRASFVTRVFEESGDYSIDRFSIPYSPFDTYVGIKMPGRDKRRTLVTDTMHYADIVMLNEDGEPVDANKLVVKIYKLQWRWWWDASDEYLANYVGSSYNNEVQRLVASTTNGKGQVGFKIEYPDWGRYMIRVTDPVSGHSTGETFYVDWPAWVNRGNREDPGGASMLSFSTDKEKYEVGEKANIVVPAGGEGRALITVENGSKVLKADWVEVTGNEIMHSIEVTPEMAPNAYIHVTLVQPHEHQNNLPIRMYGLMPIMVSDPATRLEPVITMPDELAPESEVEVKVSEKNGKGMTYTLAVVDEGLLDLTRFKTPDPHPVFYAREALGVKTWDIYDYVIGAYGAEIERILSLGGDEGISGKDKEKVNRFKPMVRFYGPFELRKGRENKHTVSIPNYIGSVRTMVVAGQDGAYGNAEKATPVKKPLMVLATLPRVLGPGEKVRLPVTVFAMDEKVKEVNVKIKANNIFQSGYQKEKTIHFDKPDDQVVNFELEVAELIGKGEVHVEVTGGGEKATYDIELEVRNPNSPLTQYIDAVVDAGDSWQADYAQFGMDGTNEVTLELSNMPPIDFKRRLKYLIGYPHGCVEQTTSKAFPQLYLKDVVDADKRAYERASDNVKIALEKLKGFQHSDGGFSFWPSGHQASDWGTSYAGHFMLEAEAKGFVLPTGMKDKWISYQKRSARNFSPPTDPRSGYWRSSYDLAQAYRLYTLAIAGEPEIGAMNRLKEKNELDQTGTWRLAAAYHLAGQEDVAEKMVANAGTFVPSQGGGYTYGSADRDKAMMLEAMSIMGKRNEAISIMKQISAALTDSRWMSTQTTAYCLLGMVKFAGEKGVSKVIKFMYDINGDNEEMTSLLPVKQVKIVEIPGDSGAVFIQNKGEGILYARLVVTGIPVKGEETSGESNLRMNVSYTNMDGKSIDVAQLEQGMDFIAEVSVTNPNTKDYLRDLALTQIFPSGWEIHNTRMDEGPDAHEADKPEYRDIRDDRVYTYFNLAPYSSNHSRHTKTFRVILNAAYLGEFYLSAVLTESMYDNRINAREKGKWVQVVKPGEAL